MSEGSAPVAQERPEPPAERPAAGRRAAPDGRCRAPEPAEPSGVDLARVALRAAKEQARARGAAAQQKKQRGAGRPAVGRAARTAATRCRWVRRSTG